LRPSQPSLHRPFLRSRSRFPRKLARATIPHSCWNTQIRLKNYMEMGLSGMARPLMRRSRLAILVAERVFRVSRLNGSLSLTPRCLRWRGVLGFWHRPFAPWDLPLPRKRAFRSPSGRLPPTGPVGGRERSVARELCYEFAQPIAGVREDRDSVADDERVEVECEDSPQTRA